MRRQCRFPPSSIILGCEALKSAHPSALPASRGQTVLAVYLEDSAAKLRLTLLYGVLPTVFTRRAILENCGDTRHALSGSL
ncbi:MAG: hypothetical protein ACLU3I_17550 [Acutalibacteraceae bacterium]